MLRTNSNKYKANLVNFINTELSEYIGEPKTVNDLLNFFDSEYNYDNNKKRYPNLQNRLKEYLQGLPYNIAQPYYNNIIKFEMDMREMEIATQRQKDNFVKYHYSNLAAQILRIADKKLVDKLY